MVSIDVTEDDLVKYLEMVTFDPKDSDRIVTQFELNKYLWTLVTKYQVLEEWLGRLY